MRLESHSWFRTEPRNVKESLDRHILADGLDLIFDPSSSHDAWMVDARDGSEYLDLFSFFASLPLGFNHPGLREEAYVGRLSQAAAIKPTCSDVYTQAMADFVAAFARTLPPAFKHLFFVEGGALAVENALKAAFDWKVRKNIAAGRSERLGSQIIHFQNAFHGRSGYTLSLTNTFDPRKTQYFPKFDWPRIDTPGRRFPENAEALAAVEAAEAHSVAQIKDAISRNPHDIAALIIETIQGEGGDVHFRPEFFRKLRELCDQEEIILIFDEVQCGMGLTGRWWAFEHMGVEPDVFSFGKKTQVCGIAAGPRLDEVDSVFEVSSRINSTWGGNLVDMVRCERFIQIIEEQKLLDNARDVGAYALDRLEEMAAGHGNVDNVRGRGLMCAFDLADTATRDAVKGDLQDNQKVLMLASGQSTLRFRPVLDFTRDHVDEAIRRIDAAIRSV
ncbi:MAG: L-lysine 6-transaminase [Planctomycetes bacterium]|nr:L-lysine 6-transaminase [Planctomycetota bacterium]